MNNIVIQVENVSKQYRLGQVGRRSLSQDVNRWWHTIRGKENPYLKIGQENDRTSKSNGDYVWVLRDINFQVNHGEVLGVIGRNGAGKSTLLKLLSKVTSPTEGQIKIKGRIASLLEVGTGFHPELSGRDNIFLNGAILGMNRKEIASKFDAIVDFAGVEKYIDTPVKRYSSGMYVRLAFAVAAHLEPDILIVDEVLAVGDAEFQKKCLGKMKDVSEKEGRTVLFVSHNMAAVETLCNRAVLLDKGKILLHSQVSDVITSYIRINSIANSNRYLGNGIIKKALIHAPQSIIKYQSEVRIEVAFSSLLPIRNLVLGVVIKDAYNVSILGINNRHYLSEPMHREEINSGKINVQIKRLPLMPGDYTIDLFLGDSTNDIEKVENAFTFTVEESSISNTATILDYKLNKVFTEDVEWSYLNC